MGRKRKYASKEEAVEAKKVRNADRYARRAKGRPRRPGLHWRCVRQAWIYW